VVVISLIGQLIDGNVSGIMGLAFDTIASPGTTPFWQALANNKQLPEPEMSFFFTRSPNQGTAQSEEPGGVFTLGGTNATLFKGDIEFINMPSNSPPAGFWILQLTCMIYRLFCHACLLIFGLALNVGGSNVQIATGNAAVASIDTGTTLIGSIPHFLRVRRGPDGD
jgi:cathepsin D